MTYILCMNGTPPATRTAWAARRPAYATWLLVALAHGVLALAWQMATRPPASLQKDALVWLHWPHAVVQSPVPSGTHLTRTSLPVRAKAAPGGVLKGSFPVAAEKAPFTAALPTTPYAPAAIASAPAAAMPMATTGSELLIDTEATRRAVRQIAREHGASRQARISLGQEEASTPTERLGQAVKQAGKGDCLKGEFPGAGMGLLSLPLFLAAELMEKCSR
jgi:hypothetical protein